MVEFKVNGKNVSSLDTDLSLLKCLREVLNLTGAKQGCETGHCGSCTVIVNGKTKKACSIPLAKLQNAEVITIEGLANEKQLHPLQEAFAYWGAVQCGYCTPGILMAAKVLLDANLTPSRDEIIRALHSNYCRCGGYQKIINAILWAAAQMRGENLPLPYPGKQISEEQIAKVTGEIRFAADLSFPDMKFAKVLGSSHVHAQILKIDVSTALTIPGVIKILTINDIPGKRYTGKKIIDQPILADQIVRYAGEPIALVVANSETVAAMAISKISVEYLPQDIVDSSSQVLADGAPVIGQTGRSNLCDQFAIKKLVAGHEIATISSTQGRYSTPINEHAYLETEAGVALWEGGQLTIYTCTQGIHDLQASISETLALPIEKVRVIQTPTGGGFGGKSEVVFGCLLALACYQVQMPVKMVYSRSDSFSITSKRHPFVIDCQAGVDNKGNLTALKIEALADTGAYAGRGPYVIRRAGLMGSGPYEIAQVDIMVKAIYTNNAFCSSMRGFGIPQIAFALESEIDMLANESGIDPWKIRYDNALQRGSSTATGQTIEWDLGFKEVLEALKPDWENAKSWKREPSKVSSLRRGVGIASGWMGAGQTCGQNLAEAIVELAGDGKVYVNVGSADIGQGFNETIRQLVSTELGQNLTKIVMINNDTAITVPGDITHASRLTYYPTHAVLKATRGLKASILQRAGAIFPGELLSLGDGGIICNSGKPLISLAQLVNTYGSLNFQATVESHGVTRILDQCGQGVPYETYAFAAAIVSLTVNAQDGSVKVDKVWISANTGKTINRCAVDNQLESSVTWGIGFALMEEYVPGKTLGFGQYQIPKLSDMPEVLIRLVEVPQPGGPDGAIGIAELGMFPVAPAITNAIYSATGFRPTTLPVKQKEILAYLNC